MVGQTFLREIESCSTISLYSGFWIWPLWSATKRSHGPASMVIIFFLPCNKLLLHSFVTPELVRYPHSIVYKSSSGMQLMWSTVHHCGFCFVGLPNICALRSLWVADVICWTFFAFTATGDKNGKLPKGNRKESPQKPVCENLCNIIIHPFIFQPHRRVSLGPVLPGVGTEAVGKIIIHINKKRWKWWSMFPDFFQGLSFFVVVFLLFWANFATLVVFCCSGEEWGPGFFSTTSHPTRGVIGRNSRLGERHLRSPWEGK